MFESFSQMPPAGWIGLTLILVVIVGAVLRNRKKTPYTPGNPTPGGDVPKDPRPKFPRDRDER